MLYIFTQKICIQGLPWAGTLGLIDLLSRQLCEMDDIPILQVRKLRLREVM